MTPVNMNEEVSTITPKKQSKRFLAKIKKILEYGICYIEKALNESVQSNKTILNSLAPKILTDDNDIARIKPYLDCLKEAIDTDDINNIALTGSYGSGKSTILKTFQHLYPNNYSYLNISLASFKENKEIKEDDSFERRLEISILQQMFYHVEPSEIPDSRFKRIINLTDINLYLKSISLITWILCVLILFKFNYIENLNPQLFEFDKSFDWITFLSSCIFFGGIGLFVKHVSRFLSNSKISKLNIKGELELGESTEKSIFNQHLEEILYFFERTKFNVIIIEDVDRFNNTAIFTKLREINILINNSNSIKHNVKFIYAIKDEMFVDKNERVKFFEFIIPVIPFINPSNAKDQLSNLISNANLQGTLSSDFTSDIVTFIDDIDMRLLINIFQEYQMYKTNLSSELKQDKLFAMIVYKNMFPDDFGELPKRRGNLYKFIASKPTYIKDLKVNINSKIEGIENQIKLIEKEVDKPIKELRAVYIYRIISHLNRFENFQIDTTFSLIQALEDNYFNKIRNASNIQYSFYYGHNSHTTTTDISFSTIEKEISDLTYDQREKLLNDKATNQVNLLKIEKENLKIKIAELESQSLQEIFESVDITTYLTDFNNSFLMRNLLLNGYLDEHYDDYISLFHEGNLTKEDFAFEKSVKSGLNVDFEHQITNFENLFKNIPDRYFKREVILNYSILEYLLKHKDKHKYKHANIFACFKIDGERQFQFIKGIIKRETLDIKEFISELCKSKPSIWHYLKEKSDLPENETNEFLTLIFEYADKESILNFEDVDSLVIFFERMDNFFEFSSSLKQTDTLQFFISQKKLLLGQLDLPNSSQTKLSKLIFNNNNYKLNEHNIGVLLQIHNVKIDNSEYYTTLLKSNLKNLLFYISTNLEDFIENVMLKIKGNANEDEKTIIDILNRENISLELKEKLINSQQTKIKDLSKIDGLENKELVLSNNKLLPTWNNIYDYYDATEEDEFNVLLVKTLNTKVYYENLSTTKLNSITEKGTDYIKKIAQTILHCDALEINAYENLLDCLPYIYQNIFYNKISNEKKLGLISKKIITLSNDNFNGLKSEGNNLHIKLIEVHQDDFVKNHVKLMTDLNDWILIFDSASISLFNKLEIIRTLDISIITDNIDIAKIVFKILPSDTDIPLNFNALEAIFNTDGSITKKIELLLLNFSSLGEDSQIQKLIETLGGEYAKIFKKQHKPVFDNIPQNVNLFKKLKEKDLIIRYEQGKNPRELKVIAKY